MRAEIVVESGGKGLHDITTQLERFLKASGLEKGIAILYSVDPLCRLVTIEYDSNLIEDLMTLISNLKLKTRT